MITGSRQRVLVVDHFLPMPDRSSGSHRIWQILRLLVDDGHEVTFLARNGRLAAQYAAAVTGLGVTVIAGDRRQLAATIGYANIKYAAEVPNGAFELAPFLRSQRFDTAIVCFHDLAAQYLPLVRRWSPDTRVVVDSVDLHFVRERRAAEQTGDPDARTAAELTRTKELGTYAQADAVIAITEMEKRVLIDEGIDKPIHVVPNVHDIVERLVDFDGRRNLLFVGNFWHPPNVEGITWFCREVLPRVREHLPNVTTTVVGQNPPEGLAAFASLGVQVKGWVPSLDSILQTHRLAIAPLLTGAGMKGKVGQALACGLPTVTTSIGSEGMGLTHGENAMVADSAEDFAAAVVEAYRSGDLWDRLSAAGQAHTARLYSPAAVRNAVRDVVPPPITARQHFMLVPDWQDPLGAAATVDHYVRAFAGSTTSSLEIGVLPEMPSDAAAVAVMQWLVDAGHDLETVPDISITPLTLAELVALPPDVVRLDPAMHIAAPAGSV